MDPGVVSALIGSGPMGLLALVMWIWRKEERADRKTEADRRAAYDERRLDADIKMATALTSLAMKITGTPNGQG